MKPNFAQRFLSLTIISKLTYILHTFSNFCQTSNVFCNNMNERLYIFIQFLLHRKSVLIHIYVNRTILLSIELMTEKNIASFTQINDF